MEKRHMKITGITGTIGLIGLIGLTGCGTMKENLSKGMQDKNIHASGSGSIQKIDTGYDAVTGSTTPKALFIAGSFSYKSTLISVPEGNKVPTSGDYKREESTSIFNSAAKNVVVNFSFTAANKEEAETVLDKVISLDAQQGKN